MKCKFVLPVLTFFVSVAGLAQKNEIKDAQSKFSAGKASEALAVLKASEYLIVNAKEDEKSEFYNLKAKVFMSLADKDIEAAKNFSFAALAYQELIAEEVASGNFKYAAQAKVAIKDIKTSLNKSALTDVSNDKYFDAGDKMYSLYQIDKKDTTNLFFSASHFVVAKEYDLALRNYKELASLNYSGKGMSFTAVNKKNSVQEVFASAVERDLSVKNGSHEKPGNVVVVSRKTDIHKNIAFIYTQKGDLNSAEEYYKKILDFNPGEVEAYLNLAYLKVDKNKLLVAEMSALGTSAKDMVTYEELKVKKDGVLKSAVSYLEKGNAMQPKNTEVLKLLLNLYRALDMMTEYNTLKTRI